MEAQLEIKGAVRLYANGTYVPILPLGHGGMQVEGDLTEIGAKLGEEIMKLIKPALNEHVARLRKEAAEHVKQAEGFYVRADEFENTFGKQLQS